MYFYHHHHHHHDIDHPPSQLYLVEPPEGDVVPLDDMKAHLRVDFSDDDVLIKAMTDAVTEHLDGKDGDLGRALLDQTWELGMAWFPRAIRLPLPPLIDVEAVEYLDTTGAAQTFDPAKYFVTGQGGRGYVHLVSGQCWPIVAHNHPEAVTVRFRAGYLDGGVSPPQPNVPAPIIAAIKLMVGDLYANRETMLTGQRAAAVTLPWAAEQLLERLRVKDA